MKQTTLSTAPGSSCQFASKTIHSARDRKHCSTFLLSRSVPWDAILRSMVHKVIQEQHAFCDRCYGQSEFQQNSPKHKHNTRQAVPSKATLTQARVLQLKNAKKECLHVSLLTTAIAQRKSNIVEITHLPHEHQRTKRSTEAAVILSAAYADREACPRFFLQRARALGAKCFGDAASKPRPRKTEGRAQEVHYTTISAAWFFMTSRY